MSPLGPWTEPLKSSGLSDSFLTSRPVSELFLTSLPDSDPFLTSLPVIALAAAKAVPPRRMNRQTLDTTFA